MRQEETINFRLVVNIREINHYRWVGDLHLKANQYPGPTVRREGCEELIDTPKEIKITIVKYKINS